MNKSQNIAAYIAVAEEIIADIERGCFKPGDRLYSRREIAEKYHVGEVTAVNAQNYLVKHGIVRKLQGKGCFVNFGSDSLAIKLEKKDWSPVKKIVDIRFDNDNEHSSRKNYYDEVERALRERRLPDYQLRYFSRDEVASNLCNTFPPEEHTGYLIFYLGAHVSFFTARILLNPLVHSVVIDAIFPDANCILTDSFDGMGQIVEYAAENGCQEFIFAKNYIPSLGTINNEERAYGAVFHCVKRGLNCRVINTGSYDELKTLVGGIKRKTAVMFPQDEGALIFKRLLKKYDHVMVTGFDDFPGGENADPSLPTITHDYRTIIDTAFDILTGKPTKRKQIIRIKGNLKIGNYKKT